MLTDYPAFVRLYDALIIGGEDLRTLSWTARREQLEGLMQRLDPQWFDLSAVIEAEDSAELTAIRATAQPRATIRSRA